jgi:hypothetical protein
LPELLSSLVPLKRGDVMQSIMEKGANSKKSLKEADEAAGMATRWG